MKLKMNPSRKKSKNSSMSGKIAAISMLYWRPVIGLRSICSKVVELFITFLLYLRLTLTSSSISLENRDGPNRRTGATADAQRKTDKRKPLAYQLVEIRQVLVVRNAVLSAHHV